MSPSLFIGTVAALVAAVLGSAWQLLTRHGVTTILGPMEIAVLRYGIPALLLAPVVYRVGLKPRGVPAWRLAVMAAGGGLPFGLLVFTGAQLAPASHIGVFMAGTVPVFTALGCRFVLGESIAPSRWAGLALIVAGLGALVASGGALGWSTWRGDLLLVLAAAVWAGYTLAFRGSGLTPLQGAAVINAWSLIALLFLLPWIAASRFTAAPWRDLAVQAVGQGVLVGCIGLAIYMVAVSHLGSSRAALSTALVPPMTAWGAAWVLGEPASGAAWGASLAAMFGMLLASGLHGAIGRPRRITP
jgi:drug/metabolite transporter (DMT)-like permease